MAEELADLLGKFDLSNRELNGVDPGDIDIKVGTDSQRKSVLWKIIGDKEENLEANDKAFLYTPIWVQAWNLALHGYSKEEGFKLGNGFNKVFDVKIPQGESNEGWHMKLLVVLDLSLPILKGTVIKVKRQPKWIYSKGKLEVKERNRSHLEGNLKEVHDTLSIQKSSITQLALSDEGVGSIGKVPQGMSDARKFDQVLLEGGGTRGPSGGKISVEGVKGKEEGKGG
ncbi:hypothetical protein ACH5RR_041056 [Cinchona calisaya]|uniref:DUF4283 domain-containing protein n=1 Tax=Cinchona calisaya TaxID=153742 RepID=A0ABD2XVP9_9GENT